MHKKKLIYRARTLTQRSRHVLDQKYQSQNRGREVPTEREDYRRLGRDRRSRRCRMGCRHSSVKWGGERR
uniref:Uncharacterized protein n=1 Tax=Manihot esculenta TaxID=3983 RepID=A0A2C9UUG8_MANES